METREHILRQAILLFAQRGYDGVSMRDLAKSAGLGVSGIYHHFPDKKTLHFESIQMAFSNKALAFSEVWQAELSAAEKLKLFVSRLTTVMLADKDFHRLMQRELLDADKLRMEALARGVFKTQFAELQSLLKHLHAECDAHLMAVSVIGLVCYHLEMEPLRQFFPGYKAEHENGETIANHVTHLLLSGLNVQG